VSCKLEICDKPGGYASASRYTDKSLSSTQDMIWREYEFEKFLMLQRRILQSNPTPCCPCAVSDRRRGPSACAMQSGLSSFMFVLRPGGAVLIQRFSEYQACCGRSLHLSMCSSPPSRHQSSAILRYLDTEVGSKRPLRSGTQSALSVEWRARFLGDLSHQGARVQRATHSCCVVRRYGCRQDVADSEQNE